jgi:hypothetical protein
MKKKRHAGSMRGTSRTAFQTEAILWHKWAEGYPAVSGTTPGLEQALDKATAACDNALAQRLETALAHVRAKQSLQPSYMGAGKIRFPNGSHPPVKLSESQTLAFEALLEAGGAADSAELASRSQLEHAPRLLHYIVKTHRMLRPFFRLPGHKSQGGFSTSIQWDR